MATRGNVPLEAACLPLIPTATPKDLPSLGDDTHESTELGSLCSSHSLFSPLLSESSTSSSCDISSRELALTTLPHEPLRVQAPTCPKPKAHFKKKSRFWSAALTEPETCLSSGDISMVDACNAIKTVAPDAEIACLCDAAETAVGTLKNLMNAEVDALGHAGIAFLLVQRSEHCFCGLSHLLKRNFGGSVIIPVLMEQFTIANGAALCKKIATLIENGADDVLVLPASAADLPMMFSTSLAKSIVHRELANNLKKKLRDTTKQCDQLFWQDAHRILPGFPEQRSKMVEIPGQRAGNLVLQGLLAEGGFGEVHKCADIETGEIHAVKVLSKRRIRSCSQLQQIAMEYSFLCRVSHPNVVSGFQFLHGVQNLYLTMEIAGPRNLYKTLKAEGKKGFPWELAQRLLFQIASGVAYLHEEGIAHLDLKPENIAISKDDCAKIVDFGEAVDVTSEVSVKQKIRGTMPFIPPEVLLLSPQWDPVACDLWHLGVIHFEILCGVGSFEQLMGWVNMNFRSHAQLRGCAEDLMLRFAEAAKANTLEAVLDRRDQATPLLAIELLADMLQLATMMRLPASSVASRLDC